MNSITFAVVIGLAAAGAAVVYFVNILFGVAFLVLAVLVGLSLEMANAWEKFVVLRAGKLQGVKGPGLFFILPVVDSITAVIDGRI